MKRGEPSQTQRFIAFLANSLLFYFVYVWATNHWYVTGGGETLWLASAVSWWILGLLSAPWYRPPRDALGASVAALTALFTLDLTTAVSPSYELTLARNLAIAYAILVGVAALVAAIIDSNQDSPLQRFSYLLAERLSSGAFIFGTIALISIFGFYSVPSHLLVLTTLWLLFAIIRPIELAFSLWNHWKLERAVGDLQTIGRILRVDDPNIVRVSVTSAAKWEENLHVACLAGGLYRYVIPLFSHIQDELTIGTGLIVPEMPAGEFKHLVGTVIFIDDAGTRARLIGDLCGQEADAEIVGFVVEGSEIADIKFEVSKRSGLQEGAVIFCSIDQQSVFYQVINASTTEESFQQNPRGTHIVSAAQLGVWSASKGFQKFAWLPRMNIPVFKLMDGATHQVELADGEFIVGNIPDTDMRVKGSLPQMIAYHTAILGVTGTGKTELVLDLVKQAVEQGTKVFCVDLTGEYRKRLANLNPKAIGLKRSKADELEEKLFDVETGEYKARKERKSLRAFMEETRDDAHKQVDDFLRAAGGAVGLFELAEVTNTRATLLATELFLSEIMLWARAKRKARRILIVLEEAHTIIPETAGAGFDYDTQHVVNKIGQIALQGRKYGVGLFIVSQRTALVSKTILSQCNTFLTHALVDQTSLQFLLNIYDRQYVDSIPNLRFLHFLAYGKGIMSERPLLLSRQLDPTKAAASAALDEFADINEEIPAADPPAPPQKGAAVAATDGGATGPSVQSL